MRRNHKKRLIGRLRILTLAAFLLLSLPILFSCSEKPSDVDTEASESIPADVTDAITEPEKQEKLPPISIIANEYYLIHGKEAPEKVISAAKNLKSEIYKGTNKFLLICSDAQTATLSKKELLIGETNREESIEAAKSLNYMDYTIRIENGKIVILGGSPLATVQAARVFSEMLNDGRIDDLDAEFVYDYDFDRFIENSLAYNSDSFVPKWADDFTPPAWMLDYEEKLYAMTSPTGRITASSHRGDVQNYPENSLEAILSAIMLGADMVEIDIRLTKDNVMVLMHDDTLTRTTDWKYKHGKNGLPNTPKIEEWTYEQLCELRLLNQGKPTHYRIPTLYEAALLFRGRAQIHFDCKVSSLIDRNTDVYLLAEETGTKECFYYSFGYDTMNLWLSYDSEDKEFDSFVKKIKLYHAQSGRSLRKSKFDMLAKHGDHPDGWAATWNEGYKTVYTDKIEDFCRFSAAKQKPIPLP